MLTICLVGIFSFVALAIDVGLMLSARTQCQNAADIAALAGARTLDGKNANNNRSAAMAMVSTVAKANRVMSQPILDANVTAVTTGVYRYNTTLTRFQADMNTTPTTNEAWSAMRTTVAWSEPTWFARFFGVNNMNVNATATAVHRPRDIAIVLDFSGSMMFSSEYEHSGPFGIASLNPDNRFPRFGPWSIYNGPGMVLDYANPPTTPANLNTYSPTTPFQRVFPHVDGGGETHAENNHTITTRNGPPMISNFFQSDSTTNAFVGTFPTVGNVRNGGTWPTTIAMPAPDGLWNQNDTQFAGDKFPLRSGVTVTGTTAPTPQQYAHTVQAYLTGANTGATNTTRNATFETENATGGFDWDFAASAAKPANQRMQGFTMGPGYTGKTFYMWPPDPRTPVGQIGDANYIPGDWRERFFLPRTASGVDPNDNLLLFNTNGTRRNQTPGATANYMVNYENVLAWLRRGPQTMPVNGIRSGRVVYYDAIPTTIPVDDATGFAAGTATTEQRFWKDYIDYVIGSGRWAPNGTLIGINSANQWTGGGSTQFYNTSTSAALAGTVTARATLVAAAGVNPVPYMHYADNPIHPRMHYWFGPETFLAFIQAGWNWNPGTSYEAHCWQLKAGINSALTDIQNNHPNDLASLIYFSTSGGFATPRVAMSKDYVRMKNALFYPFSKLSVLSNPAEVVRPYSNAGINPGNPSGINNSQDTDIPSSGSGTGPEMGFKVAFNQFSRAPGFNGRRGATKMVIFETDGVPNSTAVGTLGSTGSGGPGEWRYTGIGGTTFIANSTLLLVAAKDNARAVVRQICALETASPPGYSTSRSPARVHALSFGELFEPTSSSPMRVPALRFMAAVQIDGNTTPNPGGSWANDSLDPALYTGPEPYKVITGDFNTRIDKIRQAMERIMQGGVQIALIQ